MFEGIKKSTINVKNSVVSAATIRGPEAGAVQIIGIMLLISAGMSIAAMGVTKVMGEA